MLAEVCTIQYNIRLVSGNSVTQREHPGQKGGVSEVRARGVAARAEGEPRQGPGRRAPVPELPRAPSSSGAVGGTQKCRRWWRSFHCGCSFFFSLFPRSSMITHVFFFII